MLASFWTAASLLPFVSSVSHKVGTEIEAAGTFRPALLDGKLRLLRQEALASDTALIGGSSEDTQGPRIKTTTVRPLPSNSQVLPNVEPCLCNGCLIPHTGECHSVMDTPVINRHACYLIDSAKWCTDYPDSKVIWNIFNGGITNCDRQFLDDFSNQTMTMLEVRLTALPRNGFNKVFVKMTDTQSFEELLGVLPCQKNLPPEIYNLTIPGKTVAVQGYYEERKNEIRLVMTQETVPPELKSNSSYFVIRNVIDPGQSTDVVDEEQQMQDLESKNEPKNMMSGALRKNWSPGMSFALILVGHPGSNLNKKRNQIKEAFFANFSLALSSASLGKVNVTGGVTDLVTQRYNTTMVSKSLYLEWSALADQQLANDSVWVNGQHKVFVFPAHWGRAHRWYGFAESPGKHMWLTDAGLFDTANVMHELGHNMGLNHAAFRPPNNPVAYDDDGDCSSAMSKCKTALSYTLASNWFLGWNTFQKEIRADDVLSVSVRIASHLQNESAGVLILERNVSTDQYDPRFTISFLRQDDLPEKKREGSRFWVQKVYVHEIPRTVNGFTKNVATLGLNSRYRIRHLSLAIAVTALEKSSAVVSICRANSWEDTKACGGA
jgi:hypothetical protein